MSALVTAADIVDGARHESAPLTVSFRGKKIPFEGTHENLAAFIAARKAWAAYKARAWKKLHQAERSGDRKAIATTAINVIRCYDNGARLPVTLQVFHSLRRLAYEPEIFWPVLLDQWTGYDGTWHWQQDLSQLTDGVGIPSVGGPSSGNADG
jgi:hypothetical protein